MLSVMGRPATASSPLWFSDIPSNILSDAEVQLFSGFELTGFDRPIIIASLALIVPRLLVLLQGVRECVVLPGHHIHVRGIDHITTGVVRKQLQVCS